MPREEKKKFDTTTFNTMTFHPFDVLAPMPQKSAMANKTTVDKAEFHEAAPPPKKHKGRVLIRKETAHRGGKTVVILYDIPAILTAREIQDLCQRLKKKCGVGGTVKGRKIEIQGNVIPMIINLLRDEGFTPAGVIS